MTALDRSRRVLQIASQLVALSALFASSPPLVFAQTAAQTASQTTVLSTILATGFVDPAVGLEAGTFVETIFTKKLLDSGDLVIRVELGGDTITPNNDEAYLRHSNTNGYSVLWRQSPDDPVGDLGSTLDFIDDEGRILIVDFLDGLIWLINPPGAPILLAADGAPAPGMPAGATFSQVFTGQIHFEDGVVTLGAKAVGGGLTSNNDFGVWRTLAETATLELFVQEGDNSLTPNPADVLQELAAAQSADDLSGSLVGGIGVGRNGAWRVASDGNLDLVMQTADPRPEIGAGVLVNPVRAYPETGPRRIVVEANLSGAAYTGIESAYFLYDEDGDETLIHACGDGFPGFPALPAACLANGTAIFDNYGRTRLAGHVDSPTIGAGIWNIEPDGSLTAIAHSNDQPPLPPGITFRWNAGLFTYPLQLPVSNVHDDIVVSGNLRDEGGSALADVLVLYLNGKDPELLLAPGDLVEVSPGVTSPIAFVTFRPLLNDLGVFIGIVATEAGSVVLLRGEVPEPSFGLALSIAVALLTQLWQLDPLARTISERRPRTRCPRSLKNVPLLGVRRSWSRDGIALDK